MLKSQKQVTELRADLARQRAQIKERRLQRHEQFMDRASVFALAHHYYQRLIGRQPPPEN